MSDSSRVERVIVASPHGFCAGVEKAIKALAWMTRIFPPPIYCYHEIVHNQHVVAAFEAAGVVFVDDVSQVPPGMPVMLSAHGSAPEVARDLASEGSVVIDAVCPLVTKVHHEVKSRAEKGYEIVYIGHRGHEEAQGVIAESPQAVHLVETEQDLAALPDFAGPVALLAQTTLAVPEWEGLARKAKERYDGIWMPGRSDLCYATTNRQAALSAIAPRIDACVVVGSENSSNTRALARVAEQLGVPRVLRVNDATELPKDLSGVVGVTAGASAAEDLLDSVVVALEPRSGVELAPLDEEDEYFPPPPELRELIAGLGAALGLLIGATDLLPTMFDRHDVARSTLSRLTSSQR